MRAPSTKTLIALAVVSSVGATLLMSDYYPAPIPFLGADGLPMHGANGKILVHRDMAPFYKAMMPSWILFICSATFVLWLLVRLVRFLYGRVTNHKTAA